MENEKVVIREIELEDVDYNGMPERYFVTLDFFDLCYMIIFTTKDIQNFEKTGFLENSGCEGEDILFDSADEYFVENKDEAKKLVDMIKDYWEKYSEGKSNYNFDGTLKEENK